jgi:hypothetical protein
VQEAFVAQRYKGFFLHPKSVTMVYKKKSPGLCTTGDLNGKVGLKKS